MPLWFCVFTMLFVPVICLVSVAMGAYLIYCREHKANPLRSGLADFMYFKSEPPGTEGRQQQDEIKGFYE